MSKRVLVLSASPRLGGNSDTLCDQVVLGAKSVGHQAEKIFLRDKKIEHCLACDSCKANSGTCMHNDDMPAILAKMISADVLVLATPVYFYTMNGQMKTLIDRVYPKYTEVSNKDVYFIVTAADGSKQVMERTIEEFRGFTSCLDGIVEKGIVYAVGAWNVGDIKGRPAMKQAYEFGKNI